MLDGASLLRVPKDCGVTWSDVVCIGVSGSSPHLIKAKLFQKQNTVVTGIKLVTTVFCKLIFSF